MKRRNLMTQSLKKVKVKSNHIEAAGGVVSRNSDDNGIEVLLILRNGVWDIPKGKREKGESVEMCARREVMEEVSASTLPQIVEELVTTYHEYTEKEKHFKKTTFWYSMFFENPYQKFTPQASEGIEEVRWVAIEKSFDTVGYKNLEKVLLDFRSKL
ncbi:MAG: NUDIX domain-containing protein [Balneola sp.]